MDRRGWLLNWVRGQVELSEFADCEQDLPPARRPPGALAEAQFLALCDRCDECVQACPPAAIHRYNPGTGALEGTPVMLPERRPCPMCEGFPCIAACPTGALQPTERPVWKLGHVEVDTSRCITFRGPECGACVGVCPGELKALALERCRPVVDEEQCVGCGLCIEACPTDPKALIMSPSARRDVAQLPVQRAT